jgi:hypothetical protein
MAKARIPTIIPQDYYGLITFVQGLYLCLEVTIH